MSDDQRPAPLIPDGTDITGLDGFMLDVERLMASELWALSSGDEFKAALGLWCRAWKQNPPGSLPNDDKVLAAFSGAGARWKKVRAVALRGFVLCSDGRLYHRVLCEDVLRAAQKKADRHERTRAATEARRRQRDVERDVERDEPQNGNVTTSHRQGQGQGHRQTTNSTAYETARAGTGLDDLRDALFAAAKPGSWPIAASPTLKPIPALLAEGCDLDLDVLPAIATLSDAARKAGTKIGSWGYFANAIREARDARNASRGNGSVPSDPGVPMVTDLLGRRYPRVANLPDGWPDVLACHEPRVLRDLWEHGDWRAGSNFVDQLGPPPGDPGCLLPEAVQREWGALDGKAA